MACYRDSFTYFTFSIIYIVYYESMQQDAKIQLIKRTSYYILNEK
jgi:hypothetical protein